MVMFKESRVVKLPWVSAAARLLDYNLFSLLSLSSYSEYLMLEEQQVALYQALQSVLVFLRVYSLFSSSQSLQF